jgi:hypothetical protein
VREAGVVQIGVLTKRPSSGSDAAAPTVRAPSIF